MKDKEVLRLVHPRIVICEWIPFGTSNLLALNNNLGAFKRIKNALFTRAVSVGDSETSVIKGVELTKVYVRDYDPTDYVKFEAEIFYPNEPEIVQEESFGCYVNHTGKAVYGLELISTGNRESEAISVDDVSRILVDIWEDSSKMMSTLISPYQQDLLELVFQGHASTRDKFNLVIADGIKISKGGKVDEIHPPSRELSTDELRDWSDHVRGLLIDGQECEAELRQMVSDVQDILFLATGAFVVQGTHGVLFVRGTKLRIEDSMSSWMFLKAVAIFLENLFHRLFVINSTVLEIQNLMNTLESDPTAVSKVQGRLVTTSADTSFIEEIVNTLEDAVARQEDHFHSEHARWQFAGTLMADGGVPMGSREANIDFVKVIELEKMFGNIDARVTDMKNTVHGTQLRLAGLRDNISAFNERRMHQVQKELQENSRTLEDITRTNERTGSSLQILELILAAALAFELLNMAVGEWSAGAHLQEGGVWDLITRPGVMLGIAIIGWLVMALFLIRKVGSTERGARECIVCRITYDAPCDSRRVQAMIERKRATNELVDIDGDVHAEGERMKFSWVTTDPKWRAPLRDGFWKRLMGSEKQTEVTLVFDCQNGYMLSALVEVPSPPADRTMDDIERMLTKELIEVGVFGKDPMAGRRVEMAREKRRERREPRKGGAAKSGT